MNYRIFFRKSVPTLTTHPNALSVHDAYSLSDFPKKQSLFLAIKHSKNQTYLNQMSDVHIYSHKTLEEYYETPYNTA